MRVGEDNESLWRQCAAPVAARGKGSTEEGAEEVLDAGLTAENSQVLVRRLAIVVRLRVRYQDDQ